jgi:hypothetical protein
MKLIIRPHARRRMAQRGIGRAHIRRAIENCHTRYETPNNSICYIGPGEEGRDLKVWVLPDSDPATSVTVKSVAWRGEAQ